MNHNGKDLFTNIIRINDKEFKLISKLIYDRFGIYLPEQKKTLVEGRLNKVLKDSKFNNFEDYYNYVTKSGSEYALLVLIDRISTNHTFFFREKNHFEYLVSQVLPQIINENKSEKSLRIWCAGCSSGEECYTLGIVIKEFLGDKISTWDIGILGTDISITSLEQANIGIYSLEKLKEVNSRMIYKYFTIVDNTKVKVKNEIKDIMLFKRLNLMSKNYPFKGKFHIIFCRNVMIYFDKMSRKELVNKFYKYTYDQGYLFIGHSEALPRESTPYNYVMPGIYRKL